MSEEPSESGRRPKRLLEQAREKLRAMHYSYRTEQAYLDWMKRYILFHGKRHPKEMGAGEIEAFVSHLANERRGAYPLHDPDSGPVRTALFVCDACATLSDLGVIPCDPSRVDLRPHG